MRLVGAIRTTEALVDLNLEQKASDQVSALNPPYAAEVAGSWRPRCGSKRHAMASHGASSAS